MSVPVENLLAWANEGQDRLEEKAAALPAHAVHEPSALEGWTRGHVLTHLSRNADALVNLLTWARTGEVTPMYPSTEARAAEIEAGAGRGLDEQLADLRESGRRFREAVARVPGDRWASMVKSAQGRDIEAREVLWLRVREVWVHQVDLKVGISMDAIPGEIAWHLVRDVAGWTSSKVDDAVVLRADGFSTARLGTGEPRAEVSGSAQSLAGWLTGRTKGENLRAPHGLPVLPRWL